MERDRAPLELIVHAVKRIEIGDLEHDEALGRSTVLERPLDQRVPHLRGPETDGQIGACDRVERWLAARADLSIDTSGDGPRWNRTISFEVITLDALPGRFRSIGGPAWY